MELPGAVEQEMKNLMREHLSISVSATMTSFENTEITVSLKMDGKVISSDVVTIKEGS